MPNNVSKIIPVVFSCGSDFVVPTYVAIFSLLRHGNKNRYFNIYILTPGNFSEDIILFLKHLESIFSNCVINIIDMGDKYRDIPIKLKHVRYPSFYRLSIPKTLDSFDKCLYLDSDTIVANDISEYFDLNISGFDIAGVLDMGFFGDDAIKHAKLLGIKNLDSYINSGTLLMNLSEIRKHGICNELEKGAYNLYPCVDQDVFNSLCYGRIMNIPIKFNAMTRYTYYGDRKTHIKYGIENIKEAKKNPVVIHYIGGKVKPWSSRFVLGSSFWWNEIKRIDRTIVKTYIKPFLKKNKISFKLRITILVSTLLVKIRLYGPIVSRMKKNGAFKKIKKKL